LVCISLYNTEKEEEEEEEEEKNNAFLLQLTS